MRRTETLSRAVVVFALCVVFALLPHGLASSAEPAGPAAPTVRLRNATLHGAADPAGLPARLRAAPEELFTHGGKAIVRFHAAIDPERRRILAHDGIRLLHSVDRHAYIANLPPRTLSVLQDSNDVAWVAPFHPGLKIADEIAAIDAADERDLIPVTLHLFADADPVATVERLRAMGLDVKSGVAGRASAPGRADRPGKIVLLISPARLVALRETFAGWPETLWIGRRPVYRLHNDGSPWAMQGGLATNKATPANDHGLFGQGQLIGILDTGLDADMCFFRDDLLGLPPVNLGLGAGNPDPAQRKVTIVNFLWASDNPSDPADWDSQDHGTHVAGSAAGDNLANPGLHDSADGMAPLAKLVIQDGGFASDNCADLPAIGCPAADLYPFFEQAYLQGARLHSNSWGDRENFTPLNIYSEGSEAADAFMWDHPDFLLFFSAGNSGPSTGTVASPASAKNVVAVGASGRAGSSRFLAGFSSRGPTHDGRIKPDITAPGQFIRSADNDRNINSNNCFTKISSGTSMSCPTAAGATALVREYYTLGFYPRGVPSIADQITPSAALLKATLIASATPMEDVADSPPSDSQGWGRVLLDDALFFPDDRKRLFVADVPDRFASPSDPDDLHTLEVRDGLESLRVVLAWTDYPSTPIAGVNLVNDLDLELLSPSGTLYRGNVFSGGVSQPGGSADTLNNVEAVRIDAPERGTWTVRVIASAIPQPDQGYALVATGQFPAPGVYLQRTALAFDDGVGGNGNGILEPGEWADLPLTLRNTGDTSAANVRATLESLTPEVEIVTAEAALGTLGADAGQSTGPVHLRFRLATGYPCTQPFDVRLRYEADGYQRTEDVTFSTGESVFLTDDLEPGTSWQYVAAESDAFRGNWELGDPDLTQFQPGLDVTPDPGNQCLFTGPNPSGDDVGDVQAGVTVARSGAYDLSGHAEARVRLHRWWANRDLGEDVNDYLRLRIRENSLAPDTTLEELGTNDNVPQWVAVNFRVADFVPPGPAVELSVIASDGPSAGNVIEAAIDEVVFWEPACELYDPAPNPVDDLRAARGGADVVLEWSRPDLDPAHGEADRYRVYRSTAPDTGFALQADFIDPLTSVTWTDTGAVAGPALLFYRVVAANPAGDAEPAP